MENIIRDALKGISKQEVQELLLDSWRGSEISPEDKLTLESFPNLQHLALNNTGLSSLANFPTIDSVLKLDLSDNNISSGLSALQVLQELMQINFQNNKISSFDQIATLASIKDLIRLDLVGNPVEDDPNYFEKVFQVLPGLEILDGKYKDGNQVVDLDEEEEEEEYEIDSDQDEEEELLQDDSDDNEIELPAKRPAPDSSDNAEKKKKLS